MSPELAAGMIESELGAPPDQVFAQWDPEPIAAASIGQVHRAITRDGQAVAVKVQYPGIAETMAADLDNVALLRRMLRITAPSQDVDALITELRDRVLEELDYRREAANQTLLHDYFDGHPTISVPAIIGELSTQRVVTSELVTGARFAELADWPQEERDLAGETMYRFVFRSLYEMHAFNGDPHPGNYLFHGGGKVTFLDFGMVKHFTDADVLPLMQMARNLCVEGDPARFRASMEVAGFLVPGAPLSDAQIVDHLAVFYQLIQESKTVEVTSDYATAVVRRFFDVRSPVAQYAADPAVLRHPAADQPRPVRAARRHARDRELARHRRGDLAVPAGAAVHADGARGGGLESQPASRRAATSAPGALTPSRCRPFANTIRAASASQSRAVVCSADGSSADPRGSTRQAS